MRDKFNYIKDLTDFDEQRNEDVREFIRYAEAVIKTDRENAKREREAEEAAYRKKFQKDRNIYI